MDTEQIAIEFAKKYGFDTVVFRANRRGLDVYNPAMDNAGNGSPVIGYPVFITVSKSGEAGIVVNDKLLLFDELFPA
ncbi:MAG: hypothetical protein LBR26_02430 [Prevotella sp.]|jgi:hypothetical protein|nr:hypothetical protein [Prevotella sp.]